MHPAIHKTLVAIGSGALAAATAVGPAYAQQEQPEPPSGTVLGEVYTVVDGGERQGVSGAQVTLVAMPGAHLPGQMSPDPRQSACGPEGKFSFEDVPPGCYLVSATSQELGGSADQICLLGAGGVIELAIEMKPGMQTASIEVSARAQASEQVLKSTTFTDIPSINERFQDYLPLLPGVIRGPDGRINMKGARATQSGALINSANVTDPVTGLAASNLPIDAVVGVSVLSNPYDSQYGKFAGAISSVDTNVSKFNKFRFKAQNVIPRLRRRDGAFVGIAAFTPRLTVSSPLFNERISVLQSLEYRFVRTEIEDAGLPQLERDTTLESLDSFSQVNFQFDERHSAALNFALYPQKQNYFRLNTFLPQPATPDLRQRGYRLSFRDMMASRSGSVLQSLINIQTFEADVRAHSNEIFRVGIETAQGGFFNRQNRESTRIQWSEIYHLAPTQGQGRHMVKFGFNLARNNYEGDQVFRPVDFLGLSDALVKRIDFAPPAFVEADQVELSLFIQDKWAPLPRLSFDLGLRFERDSIADANHLGPRIGFTYLLTSDNRTVLRGGAGLFHDRVTLNIPTFLSLPSRTERLFSPGGALLHTRAYRHRQIGEIRTPRSYVWSLQLDRELARDLFLRLGFQRRNTTRDTLLHPQSTPGGDFLTMESSGRNRYREFELTMKYHLSDRYHLTGSYVRSSAFGDLNDFTSFFGNFAEPLIRPNERAPLPFDAPNRFLFWASIKAPRGIVISPVFDIHSGFPYSLVDEQRDFVGRRNEAGRFPVFASIDLQILKRIEFNFRDETREVWVGVKAFNLLNRFNPRDIQNNLASPRFGTFFNSKDRSISAKFIFGF